MKHLHENGTLPNPLPDTSNEVPPLKILQVDGKYGKYTYDASTPQKLIAATRAILSLEGYSYYGAGDKPISPVPEGFLTSKLFKELPIWMQLKAIDENQNYEKRLKHWKLVN